MYDEQFNVRIKYMTGGILHLSIQGEHDKFLTSNPQITFFKSVYKRHTNFAIESIHRHGHGDLRFGGRLFVPITRIGDLVHQIFLDIRLPNLMSGRGRESEEYYASWVNSIGHAMIKYVDIEIGGCIIDRHYGQWMEIWGELTTPIDKRAAYNKMIGHTDYFNVGAQPGELRLHVPLHFWFNRNMGLALPLIALERNDVQLHIEFRQFSDLWVSSDFKPPIASIVDGVMKQFDNSALSCVEPYIDYIFLEDEERRWFVNTCHEILFEQVQFIASDAVTADPVIPLTFTYPVKELIWVIQDFEKIAEQKDWFNFSDMSGEAPDEIGGDPLINAKLVIEGRDRFEARDAEYFRRIQPYQWHTVVPNNYIYVYSFSAKPEDYQPTGTLNFSKIDNADLHMSLKPFLSRRAHVSIYAVSYNVLRIEKGMAGVMYAD